ncbi:hypothetical protein BGX26_003038 [Mortierella sp. AD094]|nr:hypothetical protein BGX26_003038 [Mortierella sp. AD094]
MAIVAVVATVSAAPAAEPVAAVAAGFPVPPGYSFCSTYPKDINACYTFCGPSGFWWVKPNCCCKTIAVASCMYWSIFPFCRAEFQEH